MRKREGNGIMSILLRSIKVDFQGAILPLGTWVVKDALMAGPFPLKAYIVIGLPVIYQKLIITFKDFFFFNFQNESKKKIHH